MVVRVVFVLCCVATVLSECTYDSDKYSSYRGCVNRGHNGEVCGNWLSGGYWGDHHFINRNEAAANGIGDHNNCRNPGGQRYGGWCYKAYTREKVYCSVSDENCVTRPEDDPECPEYTAPKKKSGRTEEEEEGEEEEQEEVEPEIELIDAMLGGTLRMQCKEGCRDVVWETRPGLDTRRSTLNVLNVHPVTMETGGDWQCRCGTKRFVKKITVCTITWSECRRSGDFWMKQGRNSCTGAQTSGNCQPPKENNSEEDGEDSHVSSEYPHNQIWTTEKPQRQTEDRSGDAQARQKGEGEEGQACTGSKCGFCHRNSLLCGVLGCVAGALTVVAAVFIMKSLQWRKIARESTRNGGGTLETHLAGSVAFSRHTADRSQVGYERALQIEDLVSQLGTRSRQQGYSCSTSMTNTLNLRQLRQQDQIGRIQSGALQSIDNIACERYGEGEQYMAQLGEEERVVNQGPESLLRAEVEREELEIRKGGTQFDKYYDQDVDKWSINEEIEI